MRLIFAFSMFVCLFSACKEDAFFESSREFQQASWPYRDTLDFHFNIADTAQHYDLSLEFTFADTFSTQNIYLKLYTKFPDGKRLNKVKSFDLFDASGNANGKCSGHHCTARFSLQENAFFNRPGDYLLTLEQFTRTDELRGIEKAAFIVEKTKQKKGK